MSLANLPLFSGRAPARPRPVSAAARADCILDAADTLLDPLARMQTVDTDALRRALTAAFGGSDASGAWSWRDAWETLEVAQVLHVKQIGRSLTGRSAPATLKRLEAIAALLPTHTHRSEQQQRRQQFSTPLPVAYVLATAAELRADDIVLEPSAGTGLLAVFARVRGARLVLNELDEMRATLLRRLFRPASAGQGNAEQIHDLLDPALVPSIVLINPPFTASPHRTSHTHAAHAHLRSALLRLAPGGRMVALTLASFQPDTDDLVALAHPTLTIALPGDVYRRHGTTVATRLAVFDKPVAGGTLPALRRHDARSLTEALEVVVWHTPARPGMSAVAAPAVLTPQLVISAAPRRRTAPTQPLKPSHTPSVTAVSLDYRPIETVDAEGRFSEGLYQAYTPQRIHFPGASEHPTSLVQSAALASVMPPLPRYRPLLPEGLVDRGAVSAAQLESVVYACEAHSTYLAGVDGRTTPSILSDPPTRQPRAPCATAAAGSSATAPAPARANRSPLSCSTIGYTAEGVRYGCRCPTS
jgi:predicted RNA methylase